MSLALYRRYRPETFAEVIGQEHVTGPLQQALRNNRVNHAYLFSGPRGCGKTTSARILARALNCEQGPTPTPCGECRSCLDLARGGPGSIDVIEIDAASHGGVDDARDLRERAFFAPAASRYKIYIIDEAHMVTSAGFNALLKVVEEPPEHLKFIFATTEPEKVIGTVRSRTHHYPFRLVPPGVLRDYLVELCERESVQVEDGVLPLVVRAGAGSVRDSLSVLDQLIAGSGPEGVSYRLALGLLGYTDRALLDTVVDAFAAHDGAAAFAVVDQVIEGGYDPRRFIADLLERLRDLIILAVVPDAAAKGLIDAPEDLLERMRHQAGGFGPAELSRAADLVNSGLTEMRGAASPRLQLELVFARVMLPAVSGDEQAMAARLERLERRLASGAVAPAASDPAPSAHPVMPPPPPVAPTGRDAGQVPPRDASPHAPASTATAPEAAVPDTAVQDTAAPESATPRNSGSGAARIVQPAGHQPQDGEAWPDVAVPGASSAAAVPTGGASTSQTSGPGRGGQTRPGPGSGADTAAVRRLWPELLDAVKRRRRFTWILLSQNAQVVGVDGTRLSIGFVNPGARDSFLSSGSEDILRQAVAKRLGGDWRIECIVDPSGSSADPGGPATPGSLAAAVPAVSPAGTTRDGTGADPAAPRPARPASGPGTGPGTPVPPTGTATPPSDAGDPGAGPEPPSTVSGRRLMAAAAPVPAPSAPTDDEAAEDDPDTDDVGMSSRQLLAREFGAVVIEQRNPA